MEAEVILAADRAARERQIPAEVIDTLERFSAVLTRLVEHTEQLAERMADLTEAVAALDKYLQLIEYMPPVAKTGTMDIFKSDELFREGKVAMNIDWIGLGEASLDPNTSKVSDKLVFGQMPGTMVDGKMVRWSNIGGQPFVLTTWNDETVTKEAIDLVKWWLSKDTQTKFAQAGGQSGLQSVFNTPEYNTYRPWNHAFGPSLDWQKDVWHIPEFYELLVEQQEEFDKAITGQKSAKEALDAIAAFQQVDRQAHCGGEGGTSHSEQHWINHGVSLAS